ncbi:hypothetical protein KM792_02005 [Clostridium tyrobutyricum]|uniref:Uncharacterized protein n=1 Tax=Clostridium tyrobutyricum DIVETGP TaxID=1408889 RepID=W6N256_CLOTY|nr:hypothetical protein [Clostridium tyrobutyricum]CDL90418.1 hypothetical protein CTDIVETGP_0488 [Clostridium tyrobutyricum DIVETGP]AND83964.1 hypothetical protein CTK_C07030 [Clostridium tyrobutyricum]MBV4415670.1 hypothetical protein [Clostridium tyrobutyricum]MBV4422312.1 hypothetical protein [Clostridium tyrobutyricum]MBV4448435.1 hypothetical protein [Clostridium tyrobutyricum]
MRYVVSFLILCICYYTISYGWFLKKKYNNTLGAFGSCMLAVLTAIISITFLFIRF